MRFCSKHSKKEYKALACALAVMTSFSVAQMADAEEVAQPAAVSAANKTNEKVIVPGADPTVEAKAAEKSVKSAEPAANGPVKEEKEVAAAPTTAQNQWNAQRPTDVEVTNAAQRLVGKTIMAIEFEGITDDVVKTAQASLNTKVGDKLTIDGLSRDANNIYDTGYFYDLYPSFKEIPEGVVLTYHVFVTPIISDIEIKGNTSIESTAELTKVMKQKPGDRLNRHALQEDMAALQEELEAREYTVQAGGGAVEVTINGKNEILNINISPDIVDPDDIETLSDVIVAGVNEAIKKVSEVSSEEMGKITGSLNMPGLF